MSTANQSESELALSAIVCTRNPRPFVFDRVLQALARQSLDPQQWELVIVDNGSTPPVVCPALPGLPACRVVTEPVIGLTPARLRGISVARGELLVFVDDDNLLDSDYLATAVAFAAEFPKLGAFGGRISGEFETPPGEWLRPYLPNLAVIEVETDIVTDDPTAYDAIPCGAGLCLRREPALAYARAAAEDPRRQSLDRQGESTLSCGDWDMVLTAVDTGWSMGRFRRLHLTHVIPASRLDYAYNRKLAYGIGYSMGSLLEWRQPATAWQKFRRLARTAAAFLGLKGFGRHRCMDLSYQWGLLRGIVAAGSRDGRGS